MSSSAKEGYVSRIFHISQQKIFSRKSILATSAVEFDLCNNSIVLCKNYQTNQVV